MQDSSLKKDTVLHHLTTPLSDEDIKDLKAGDQVLLNGVVYTARDAAHKAMIEALGRGEWPPFPVQGAVIYYVGPSPRRPGKVIGSAGPTTSYRMDSYTQPLIQMGLKGTIGKGSRSPEVISSMVKYGCVYFGAVGGAAALIAGRIKEAEVISFPELGPEAVRRLVVKEFPIIVINDTKGGDLYRIGREKYNKTLN